MTNLLFNETDTEQQEIEREADNIAVTITNILVQAFKEKEQRDPTPDEVDMLLSELTEERIAEMLGETFIPNPDAVDNAGGSASEGDEDDEEEESDKDEPEEVEEKPEDVKSENENLRPSIDLEVSAKRQKLEDIPSEIADPIDL